MNSCMLAAFQAAALIATAEDTAALAFLTADSRLRDAAGKEGFVVS
jgi:predicted nucleic acid-binding protein